MIADAVNRRDLLTLQEKSILLHQARVSIQYGLIHSHAPPVDPANLMGKLAESIASFVTLKKAGELRGCIGRLDAARSLLEDVQENAYSAAFSDYRFSPLTREEEPEISLSISVLTRPESMNFTGERDLLGQIQIGRDGLIFSSRGRRGTFLPAVWDTLRTPADFLSHLKTKAGFARDYWSDDIQVQRYEAIEFAENEI